MNHTIQIRYVGGKTNHKHTNKIQKFGLFERGGGAEWGL